MRLCDVQQSTNHRPREETGTEKKWAVLKKKHTYIGGGGGIDLRAHREREDWRGRATEAEGLAGFALPRSCEEARRGFSRHFSSAAPLDRLLPRLGDGAAAGPQAFSSG